MTKDFQIKLFAYLTGGFVLFTIIGTLSHELGHYTMAKLLGYDASINYGETHWTEKTCLSGSEARHDIFLILLAGPLQTMLTGTIGLLLIVGARKKFYHLPQLDFKKWILIFVCHFWLRQIFNFITGMIFYLKAGTFSTRNDEVRIAMMLNVNKLSISFITALAGSIILVYVVFKIIPLKQRFTFITAGMIGGVFGFYFWLHWLGPIIMP